MAWMESLIGDPSLLQLDLLGKLALAALLGGVIGWEREASDKPAGLRTNLLICVGATLLGHVSLEWVFQVDPASHIRADPTRIASQIVSGIGFLGAGTIIQARGSVTGLTTAATLWVVAAIGIAVGGSQYLAAIGTTALVLVALVPLTRLEDWVARRRPHERTLRMVVSFVDGVVEELEAVLEARGLDPVFEKVDKDPESHRLVVFLRATGAPDELRQARRELVARDDVHELTVVRTAFG